MPKSYTIRDATDKELERIKAFQDGCPDFGHHNLSDEWTADTLAERSKALLDYIDEFSGTKFYEDIAYTRCWADHTGLSITTITRRAQPLVEYVLADPAWLGTDETSDCWAGLDAGKDFKFLYVGLIRLLCSVRGIQDKAHIADWFTEYDPTQTGFFGINGCDGDNKCHTVPNPVGRKQPDGYRVAPPKKKVVEIKQVEITQDSIIHHMKTNMSNEDSIELIRKLMSEFGIKEHNAEEFEKLTKQKVKYCERWNDQMKKSKELKVINKELKEQVEKPKATEDTEDTEEINYPDIDYKHLFECGAFNAVRGAMDEEYKECWKALLTKQIKTYKEWIDQEL